jgi:HEAT repeat protein
MGLGRPLNGETRLVEPALSSLFRARPDRAEVTRDDLVHLLGNENAFVKSQKKLTEEYVGYYGDLIAAVASLRDPRSLIALLGAIQTGNMAQRGLASLGTIALDPVLKLQEHNDPIIRGAATVVLAEMLDRQVAPPLSADATQRIQNGLIRTAHDANGFVRINAVKGLAKVSNGDVKLLLEGIARDDPFEASQYGGQKGIYPVREAAKRALNPQAGSRR